MKRFVRKLFGDDSHEALPILEYHQTTSNISVRSVLEVQKRINAKPFPEVSILAIACTSESRERDRNEVQFLCVQTQCEAPFVLKFLSFQLATSAASESLIVLEVAKLPENTTIDVKFDATTDENYTLEWTMSNPIKFKTLYSQEQCTSGEFKRASFDQYLSVLDGLIVEQQAFVNFIQKKRKSARIKVPPTVEQLLLEFQNFPVSIFPCLPSRNTKNAHKQ